MFHIAHGTRVNIDSLLDLMLLLRLLHSFNEVPLQGRRLPISGGLPRVRTFR
jgi:hypothetical protein